MTPKRKAEHVLRYPTVRETTCMGLPVRVFERREVRESGPILTDEIFVAYAGDAAVVTPDLDSLRDALARLRAGGDALETSRAFREQLAEGGDMIYLSDLQLLLGDDASAPLVERGGLTLSADRWENTYRLVTKGNTAAQGLLPVVPAALAAPRELLPAPQ
jgi:hypothetical protein